MSIEEWEEMKEHIQFDYIADNYFTELKEIEIRNERMNEVNQMDPYVGKYFSIEHIRRQILKQTDVEMKEIDKQIEKEMEEGLISDPAMELEMGMENQEALPQNGAPAPNGAPANGAPQQQVSSADQRRAEF